jgi:hypothetical protein
LTKDENGNLLADSQYILNYLTKLITWSRAPLERLIVTQTVKEFPAFYAI